VSRETRRVRVRVRHVQYGICMGVGVGVQVAEWLNAEYPEANLRQLHIEVGDLAERHYDNIKLGGDMDAGEVLVQLGSRLEKERWEKELFVGPWEVANKVSDILMREHMACDTNGNSNGNSNSGWDGVLSFDMDDAFEKYAFVQRVLDGKVSDGELSHVMALVAGYTYDGNVYYMNSNSNSVESKFLRENVRDPAKLLETPGIAEWLVRSLGIDEDNDPNGRKIDQLNTYISTVHGGQITAIQKRDMDEGFRRLEVIAMWLHLYGGF